MITSDNWWLVDWLMIDEVIAMGLKHDETIKFDSRGFNHQQYADISDKWCLISSWTLRIVLPYPVCWGLSIMTDQIWVMGSSMDQNQTIAFWWHPLSGRKRRRTKIRMNNLAKTIGGLDRPEKSYNDNGDLMGIKWKNHENTIILQILYCMCILQFLLLIWPLLFGYSGYVWKFLWQAKRAGLENQDGFV